MARPEEASEDEIDLTVADDDTPHEIAAPVDPAEVAAAELIRRALDGAPSQKVALATRGIVVVVEAPEAGWVAPAAAAWKRIVWPDLGDAEDGDRARFSAAWQAVRPGRWVAFQRDGAQRSHKPGEGNDAVVQALAFGYNLCGFSPAPARYLPRDLLRAADIRIALPLPDADTLSKVATAVGGGRPTDHIPDELCRLANAGDLRLAMRHGQDADAYTARLHALLAAKATAPSLTLDSLPGMDEAVAWGWNLVRDLADYRRGLLPWAAVDRGVLLHGPPGTGKTTFAQALAGSCGVRLVSGSLNQWQAAGHLGDLLRAMAATFGEARILAPCVMFIDEVDAFGDRSGFSHENRNYSVQVVNGLLEELDGVGGREGVVVVGACNDPGSLDPAITRSGRLDRMIRVPLPDQDALARILRRHLGDDLPGADLSGAAVLARGHTGADCERWIRGARRRARHGRRAMTLDDLVSEVRGAGRARPPDAVFRFAVHGKPPTTASFAFKMMSRYSRRMRSARGDHRCHHPLTIRKQMARIAPPSGGSTFPTGGKADCLPANTVRSTA